MMGNDVEKTFKRKLVKKGASNARIVGNPGKEIEPRKNKS